MHDPLMRPFPILLVCLSLLGGGQAMAQKTAPVSTSHSLDRKAILALADRLAKKHGLEPALIRAVIATESGYDPRAVSPKGAIGLMQVMPETAADYGVAAPESLFEPETNIDVGTRHLKRLMKKYKNLRQAIMAYNAGEGALARGRGLVTYPETRRYTMRVLDRYWRNKGIEPSLLGRLGLKGGPKGGRVRLVIHSTVGDLDPGLHATGPESKPMFILQSKE